MPRAGLDQSRHSPSKKREQPKLPPPSHSVDQDRSRTAEWASLLSMRRPYSSVSSIFSASPVLASGERCRPSRVTRVTWSWSIRSEEHTSELQSLMRNSYAVFCLKKTKKHQE